MFDWAKSLSHYSVCFSLSFLVACQQTGVIPKPDTSKVKEIAKCECKVIEVDEQTEVIAEKKPELQPKPFSCPKPKEQKTAIKVHQQPLKVKVNPREVKKTSIDDKLIVGRVEYVRVLPSQISLEARIDTGASLSSINSSDVTNFERDGQRWIRFTLQNPQTNEKTYIERPISRYKVSKQAGSKSQNRPVILMNLQLGSIEEQIEVILTNRRGILYQVLIGRNFLRDRAIVDVSDKFISNIKSR